jgi:hypothetical protein
MQLGTGIARAVVQAVSTGQGMVVFVVNKVTLVQVFSEYCGFLCQNSTDCCKLIIIRHNPGLAQ